MSRSQSDEELEGEDEDGLDGDPNDGYEHDEDQDCRDSDLYGDEDSNDDAYYEES